MHSKENKVQENQIWEIQTYKILLIFAVIINIIHNIPHKVYC